MVRLVIKKGDEAQFLIETTVQIPVDELMQLVVPIYNGRLKVDRLCGGKGRADLGHFNICLINFLLCA